MSSPVTAELCDITGLTLLDFPEVPAAIFWFAGCNLRCGYCYNPHIVHGRATIDYEAAMAFLKKRIGKLEGVVFSGGEPTLHPSLYLYAKSAAQMGYRIKLDTNGTRPAAIAPLLEAGLLDYVALDFKAPLLKWSQVTGQDAGGFYALLESLSLLRHYGVPYEVRTTLHPDLLSVADLEAILTVLDKSGHTGTLFVQHYRHAQTLSALPDTPRPDLGCLGDRIIER